jgi:hypothetical protein
MLVVPLQESRDLSCPGRPTIRRRAIARGTVGENGFSNNLVVVVDVEGRIKMLLGRPPKFLILLFVQLTALTFPLLMKESPTITRAEFISNAQLEFPPDKVPRLVMPPAGGQRKAKKSDAELPLTLEQPTTCPASLMPIASLIVPPDFVPRSFKPALLLQRKACCPAVVRVQG